jgi:hypothetical protein
VIDRVLETRINLMTLVDRQTRCILGWSVVWPRTQEAIFGIAGCYEKVMTLAPKPLAGWTRGGLNGMEI